MLYFPVTNIVLYSVGGQSTSILSVEPEYSLPQNSIQGLDTSSVDRMRRGPPEPYASSAIYTELNFKVCSDKRYENFIVDTRLDYVFDLRNQTRLLLDKS